jgi:hypothetical protein
MQNVDAQRVAVSSTDWLGPVASSKRFNLIHEPNESFSFRYPESVGVAANAQLQIRAVDAMLSDKKVVVGRTRGRKRGALRIVMSDNGDAKSRFLAIGFNEIVDD